MISADLFGLTPTLSADQRKRRREALRERTGSEHAELALHAALRLPERWALPPVWDPSWWDWGHTLWTIGMSDLQRQHLDRLARNMTPEQLAELWQDPSEQAAALRRVIRRNQENRA